MRWFFSTFGFLLTWWGALIVSALDSSLLVVLPFVTAMVIYLAARHRETFWIYPLMMTAGSVAGAGFTFWVGFKVGDGDCRRSCPRSISTGCAAT